MNAVIDDYIQRLGHPDIEARHQAAEAFAKMGKSAVPFLLEVLGSPNRLARRSAIKALVNIGGDSAKYPVIQALMQECEGAYSVVASILGSPEKIIADYWLSTGVKYALLQALPDGYRKRWLGVVSVEKYCEELSKKAGVSEALQEGAQKVWEEGGTLLRGSRAPENANELLRPAYNIPTTDPQMLLRATVQGEPLPDGSRAVQPTMPPSAGKYPLNPEDEAKMCYISGGLYKLGKTGESDNPPHDVALFGFHISKNLVTVGQYEAYCKAKGESLPTAPNFNRDWSKKDHPIVKVTWAEARTYAKWAGGDLPTEAEWEVASRGGLEGKEYPWGDTWDALKCANATNGIGGTMAIGSYPANGYGLHDMAGNAWEWCLDAYDASYWKGTQLLEPLNLPDSNSAERVLRGGSWNYLTPDNFRCAGRTRNAPGAGDYDRGFRVVFRGLR
ncbi:MAG: SUMF1/EgtB/PvdO family nonheme iron enzyme [Armatimonadetes bacterium]|nr:SUMF1/EgtB/PvdO family nonheme iron enzyme [Armatimonadota bacterium]